MSAVATKPAPNANTDARHACWFKRLSIKLRVSIWTSAFALLVLGVLAATILHTVNTLYLESAHTRMDDLARDASDDAEFIGGRLRVDEDMLYYDSGVSVVLLSVEDETPLSGFYPLAFPEDVEVVLDARRNVTDARGERWLVLDEASDAGFTVRAIYSLHEIEYDMHRLTMTVVGASALLALLIALGNYYIAYRAFRPVARINALARTIRTGNDLSARVPVPAARDEIYALAEEFNGMFERLQLAFDKERQFTQDASHELRTPVAAILAECELAATTGANGEMMANVRAQALHMSKLVQQLLMLARAGNGAQKLELEQVDVCETAELVCESLADAAAESHVTLNCERGPSGIEIAADQTLITRLLINLVSNAINYSDSAKNTPFVNVRCRANKDGAVVTVSDNGTGISQADLPRIFDRFFRADSARGHVSGSTGLGLSMCKWIAEAHGGTIEAESALGKGSVFTVKLPCASQTSAPRDSTVPQGQKMTTNT